jgi:predicted dehydrogenase
MGIAGCGAIAEEHLEVLRSIEALDVVALCDIDQGAVNRVSKKWNIGRCYTNFSLMLEKEDLSVVSILTPPQTHASMAIEAIRRGINVLVEKPLTMSTSEAGSILDALKGSHVKLTLNYNALLNKRMMKALTLIRESAIGQVLAMEVRMLQTKDDPMAADVKHWCHRLPGGRFGEMLAHPVYLLQSVLGNSMDLVRVLPEKRGGFDWMRYDELHVLLQAGKGIGRIYASFNAPRPAYLIDIYGTERILNIDLLNGTLMMLRHRTESKIDSAMDSLVISGELLFQTIRNSLAYLRRGWGQEPLQRAYTSLIDSIEGREELVVNADMAYNTVNIVEEICKAL